MLNQFHLISLSSLKSLITNRKKRCQAVGVIWHTRGYPALLWRTVTAS